MKTVRIRTSELRAKLDSNRTEHATDYQKAIGVYRQDVLEALKERIDRVAAGGELDLHFKLRAPEDHTEDYDRVIAMLDMSVEDVVELSTDEFNRYVLDNWDWAGNAKMLNASYSSRAR